MTLLARITVFDNSLVNLGEMMRILQSLKKLGSATTKPRDETSIVWIDTV